MTSPTLREVRELHELNVELMDTLIVIGQRLIEYADQHNILIERRDNLASLVGRAQRILLEIARPYWRNPVLSDDILQGKDTRRGLDRAREEVLVPCRGLVLPVTCRDFYGYSGWVRVGVRLR